LETTTVSADGDQNNNSAETIVKHTKQESVSPNGQARSQHDLKVVGFMNYKQRIAYAQEKNIDSLKVSSPRSLLRKSTEHMYLPR